MHAVPATALGLALLLSACAEQGGAGAAPPTSAPAGVTLPDDPDVPVLQVEYTGGFVTPETIAGRLPLLSVHADGRVFSQGPVPAIYPGPAWPNVLVHQADPADVAELVRHALDAGVAGTADLGMPGIADAPSTRFTVTTAEGTTVREVYALQEGAGATAGLTDEQQAERAELAELFAELTDLPFTLDPQGGAASSYEPTAVAALVRPWTAPEADPVVDLPLEQPAVAWPGPALPGEPLNPLLHCALATGEQAQAVTAAARAATGLTPWTTADGARWAISFRPLLPHETGCSDLTGRG
ncbi:hypothetical protein [Modestobacter versicolor]|nr:hypothetical protein [Modestobacter versicolor]MBB3678530.1 hypothetical protein [Modestobacter versicolor]